MSHRVASVPSSRHGRRWLYLFLVFCLALVGSLFFLILPLVRVTIVPELEYINVAQVLKIDLDVSNVLPVAEVIPGELSLSSEGVKKMGETSDIRSVKVDDSLVFYNSAQAQQVIDLALAKAVGSDYLLVPGSLSITEGQIKKLPSGRSFSLPLTVKAQVYRKFPTSEWLSYLPGLTLEEAEAKLSEYPGVSQVKIKLYPSFFARLSQILPNTAGAYRFSLDINGKSSILKKHSN